MVISFNDISRGGINNYHNCFIPTIQKKKIHLIVPRIYFSKEKFHSIRSRSIWNTSNGLNFPSLMEIKYTTFIKYKN